MQGKQRSPSIGIIVDSAALTIEAILLTYLMRTSDYPTFGPFTLKEIKEAELTEKGGMPFQEMATVQLEVFFFILNTGPSAGSLKISQLFEKLKLACPNSRFILFWRSSCHRDRPYDNLLQKASESGLRIKLIDIDEMRPPTRGNLVDELLSEA